MSILGCSYARYISNLLTTTCKQGFVVKLSRPNFSTSPQDMHEKFGLGTRLLHAQCNNRQGTNKTMVKYNNIKCANNFHTNSSDKINACIIIWQQLQNYVPRNYPHVFVIYKHAQFVRVTNITTIVLHRNSVFGSGSDQSGMQLEPQSPALLAQLPQQLGQSCW